MTIIKAKEFSSRSELENNVRNLVGLTSEPKTDYEVKGTRAELARLQLSDRNTFWGLRCVITDTPTKPKTQTEKIQRGQVVAFGLNNNLKKPK